MQNNNLVFLAVDRETYNQIVFLAQKEKVAESDIIARAVKTLINENKTDAVKGPKKPDLNSLNSTLYFDIIQNILNRPINAAEGVLFLSFINQYNFPAPVVYSMLNYAHDTGKDSYILMKNIMRDWQKAGIMTVEAAEEDIARRMNKKKV